MPLLLGAGSHGKAFLWRKSLESLSCCICNTRRAKCLLVPHEIMQGRFDRQIFAQARAVYTNFRDTVLSEARPRSCRPSWPRSLWIIRCFRQTAQAHGPMHTSRLLRRMRAYQAVLPRQINIAVTVACCRDATSGALPQTLQRSGLHGGPNAR